MSEPIEITCVRLADDQGYRVIFNVGVQIFQIEYEAPSEAEAHWMAERLGHAFAKAGAKPTRNLVIKDYAQIPEYDEE